jgi:hypothetical protein
MANTATGNALLGVKPIYRGELRENHDCFWNQIDQICTDMAHGTYYDQRLVDDKYIWPIMDNAIYKKGFMEHHAYCARTILPPTIWYYGTKFDGHFYEKRDGYLHCFSTTCSMYVCEMVYVLDM